MANYKESIITGTQYQRAYKVVVENTFNGVPRAIFDEELVTSLDTGEIINRHCGRISMTFDSAFTVPLINPLNNEPIVDENEVQRTATLEELYVIFYSLYFEAARLRDLEQGA